MKPFYLVVALLLILSCSNDEIESAEIEPVDNFRIENYHASYINYNSFLTPGPNLVKFEYDEHNRIIKRVGDVLSTSFGTLILSDSLYTDLTYNNDKVHLEKKIIPFGGISQIYQNEAFITLNADNKMSQKIRNYQTNSGFEIDTINYTYSNNKLISYINTSNRELTLWTGENIDIRYFEESDLYYSNNNLDSIVTLYSYKINVFDYTVLQNKETKIFSGYDSSENPFRKLQIFEETFNRSLSENNFTEYRVNSQGYHYPNNDFYQQPTVLPSNEQAYQTWDLAYDENGEWIYDQF